MKKEKQIKDLLRKSVGTPKSLYNLYTLQDNKFLEEKICTQIGSSWLQAPGLPSSQGAPHIWIFLLPAIDQSSLPLVVRLPSWKDWNHIGDIKATSMHAAVKIPLFPGNLGRLLENRHINSGVFAEHLFAIQNLGTKPRNLVAGVRRRGGGAGGAGGIDEDGGVDGAGGAGDACGVCGADALDCTWRERQQGIQKKRYVQRESEEPFRNI